MRHYLFLLFLFSVLSLSCAGGVQNNSDSESGGSEVGGTASEAGDNESSQPGGATGPGEETPLSQVNCIHQGSGQDIQVGPGKAYESLGEVDWNNLQAGDTVRIFWRDQPYYEKILIKGQGTAEQPIKVCGVANEQGQLPVISGANASSRADLDFGNYAPMETLAIILIYHPHYTTRPEYIVIEGLEIRNGQPDHQFTRTNGQTDTYASGAACIRMQEGYHITLRGNAISDCGNGLFAMSKSDNRESLTEEVLIEGNAIYNNGIVGDYLEHNLYIQAVGATYQFNYFGRNKSGSLGGNLKDRSAGTIIRYNHFEGHARYLDLVEVQEHERWVLEAEYLNFLNGQTPDPVQLAFIQQVEPRYRTAYVYGNLLKVLGSTDGSRLVHWGYDSAPENSRKGTLYFFHNTLSIESDQSDAWRQRVFDLSTSEETVEAFNNIIHLQAETQGATPSELQLTADSGVLNLGVNWISAGWTNGEGDAVVNGSANLLTTLAGELPIDLTTLALLPGSSAVDAAQAIPSEIQNQYPLVYQYIVGQGGESRSINGNGMDVGAVEVP